MIEEIQQLTEENEAAEVTRQHKPYPVCGARNKSGSVCGNIAGKGTEHVGYGRCKYHGGKNQDLDSKTFKHGLNSKISYPTIVEKAKQLREDRDVFDLRDHIFLMEAIAQTILENVKSIDDLLPLVRVIESCTKVIQRLDEIEHGRKYVISVENLGGILSKVVEVIERHVPDPYLRSLVADDILKINQTKIPALEARPVANQARS
jgi:hypothetical protein